MNNRNLFLKVMEVGKSKIKAYLVSCMYLTLYTKINPKQIIDPIMEGKKYKPIFKSAREKSSIVWSKKIFLKLQTKRLIIQQKKEWNYMKIKSFYPLKRTIDKLEWKEINAIQIPDRGLISKIYKGLLQILKNKKTSLIEKWTFNLKNNVYSYYIYAALIILSSCQGIVI